MTSAPTLFDSLATTRVGDPMTSHLAAERVTPGCKECIDAIRQVVEWGRGDPMDAFHIARVVESQHPGRWDEGTIRRRVKDAGLTKVDRLGESPRGQACDRFRL